MIKQIYGNFEYCYDGIPVIRGYCSYKTLIEFSRPHPAYQRDADQAHVDEIREFVKENDYKFMPEVILSYDCTGMYMDNHDWMSAGFNSPFQYLTDTKYPGTLKVKDYRKGVEFQRIKMDSVSNTIRLNIGYGNTIFDTHSIFNRIDGNHRLEALENANIKDFQIPYCIILLSSSGDPKLRDREKIEMQIFHNINSKVKPLTAIEQYKGLFELFSVSELEKYGKEFSITKAFLTKHKELRFSNIVNFMVDREDIILSCVKFFLDKDITVTEDDIADILSKLEHTYFYEYESIRNCKSKLAIVPYVFYCYEGDKQKNAKLSAYNEWFIKNKLYNVIDFDPSSMIDVFNSIYEIRKKQIFVAMPFKEELEFVFETIKNTIDKINRENNLELPDPIRIDKQIVGFSYDIVEEILLNIQNAGLLIADLTEQNANVYYEAGYAMGLLKAKMGDTAEILYLISNPEDPDKPFENSKFDVQHYKMIPYKNVGNGPAKLKADLEEEFKAFYCI